MDPREQGLQARLASSNQDSWPTFKILILLHMIFRVSPFPRSYNNKEKIKLSIRGFKTYFYWVYKLWLLNGYISQGFSGKQNPSKRYICVYIFIYIYQSIYYLSIYYIYIYMHIQRERKREIEREREIYYRNWPMWLWKLRNPTICHLQAGESGKPVVQFSSKPKVWETEELMV